MKIKRPPKKKFVALALIAVVLVGAGSYFLYSQIWPYNQCRNQQSSPIYNEAAAALKTYQSAQFNSIKEKILKQRNFDKDPSCLYPLIIGSLNSGDFEAATTHFESLEKVYADSNKFADVYDTKTFGDYKLLKQTVHDLRKSKGSGGVILYD